MNRRDFLFRSGAAVSLGIFARGTLSGQSPATPPVPSAAPAPASPPAPPTTQFKPLRRNVGYFTGRGGSIGWVVNHEAIAAVDSQFPDTAEIFLRDLPGRNGRMLDALINTHHHGDHTGGNGVFRPAVKTIVAQANVPEAMRVAAQRPPKPMAPEVLQPMLPDTTFPETWKHDFGDETISAKYYGPGHTKGDIVLYFEKANVVHVGDLLFNRLYPFIDRPAGASVRNWAALLEKVATEYPKDAIFVCGHGHPKFGVTGGTADVLVFRDYLSALLAYVQDGLKAGKSRDEIMKLDNLPGFPDFHVPPGNGNRLPGNLGVAYDELTSA